MRQTENHQIFTPAHIVDLILDTIGYTESNVIEKTIMEPSFGDGAFLCNIIERIIVYSKIQGFDADCIKTLILSNVYGIEPRLLSEFKYIESIFATKIQGLSIICSFIYLCEICV